MLIEGEASWDGFVKNIGKTIIAEFTKVLASKAVSSILNPQTAGAGGGGFDLFGTILGGVLGFATAGPAGGAYGVAGGLIGPSITPDFGSQALNTPRLQQRQLQRPIIIGGTITADSRNIAVALQEESSRYDEKLGNLEVRSG